MTGPGDRLTGRSIGRLERGETHWPGARRREALRAVLGAAYLALKEMGDER